MKKFHRAFNVFSCFQTHEKEIHPDSYSIKIKEQTRKLAAACTWVRQGYVDAVWRDFRRVSILSHFKTHEKESYWTWKKKTQRGLKKRSARTPTRSLISNLVKKRPTQVSIRFLVLKLMKKRSTGPKLALSFQGSWKKDPPGSEKEVRPDLFFNLRLRKASKPLRERVW